MEEINFIVEFYLSLSAYGKVLMVLTFLPYCLITFPLYFVMLAGNTAESVGGMIAHLYKSWLSEKMKTKGDR